jgi:hypothetical protein
MCKCEYREGFTICPDCSVRLVANLSEDTTIKKEDTGDLIKIEAMKPVKIKTVANQIEAELILNLLHNNNIPCFKKDIAAGGYMNIYMGYSVYGQDLYVDEGDYQRAIELLNEVLDDEEAVEAEEEELNSTTEKHVKKPLYLRGRTVIRIVLLSYVLIIILVLLFQYLR